MNDDTPFDHWSLQDEHDRLSSEDDCLTLIDRFFPNEGPYVLLGRGDDCAELRMPGITALSTDAFMEGAHFRRSYFTPEDVGAKALASAISDLAGSGAVPLGFSLGLMVPPGLTKSSLAGILYGMAGVADRYKITLTGGDVSRADCLGLCITVWGRHIAESEHGDPLFLRRAQALPGDAIFLIGQSGLAHAGLLALQDLGRAALSRYPEACAAHLSPLPLLAEGAALARTCGGREHRLGLMDLSDGPVRDLPRLLGEYGADLDPESARFHPELWTIAEAYGRNAEELFLQGGEDYALLGTCAPVSFPLVQRIAPRVMRLGIVHPTPGLLLRGEPLNLQGFDHLAETGSGESSGAALREAAGELVRLCREAWRGGLMPGYSGNASIRVALPGGGEGCLITRSGAAKGGLSEDDFVLLDLADGRPLRGENPSSEAGLHLAVYRARPESGAILHTHPPHLSALGLGVPPEQRLQSPLFETVGYREKIAWVPALEPGSAELAEAAAEAADKPALWLERHGLCVHGKTAGDCLALTEELEHLGRVDLLARRSSA